MNIKALIISLVFGSGIILGSYWFITTGSYFLLILASSLGLIFGFLLGNQAKFSKEMKGLYEDSNSKIKKR